MVSMPCAMTLGRSADLTAGSLQWIWWKPPDTPAYQIVSIRVAR
jgi:hypothetical protein